MTTLQTAASHYRKQQRLTVLAIRGARRARSAAQVGTTVNQYQLAAATMGAASVGPMLAEQGISDAARGRVQPRAFMSGPVAAELARDAQGVAQDRLVASLVLDALRGAAGVAIAVRPAVTAHVRYLSPPSCARCAVLAGQVYRWSQGFKRHPFCDCVMVPTTDDAAPGLVTDPDTAFRAGQVHGLSKADTKAISDGADIAQVVNVQRTAAGLSGSTKVMTRAGRITPAAIYRVSATRDEAIARLARAGYILPL
jgi:hypothetical protein